MRAIVPSEVRKNLSKMIKSSEYVEGSVDSAPVTDPKLLDSQRPFSRFHSKNNWRPRHSRSVMNEGVGVQTSLDFGDVSSNFMVQTSLNLGDVSSPAIRIDTNHNVSTIGATERSATNQTFNLSAERRSGARSLKNHQVSFWI